MIIHGESLEVLKGMDESSIETIITDPPYGMNFMGKKWDYDVPSVELWQECLRVLKPGGTALIFAGSRTQHRMAVNVEDAGFQIFDTIMWITGSGFPKSTNISKQLQKKCTCGTMGVNNYNSNENTKHDLRPMREANLQEEINTRDKQGEVLQSSLQEQSTQISGQEGSKSKTSRGEQPSVEGGKVHRATEGLCDDKEARPSESEKERLCTGTSISNGGDDRETSRRGGSSPSQESQESGQQSGEFATLREPQGTLDRTPPERCPSCTEAEMWNGWGTHLKPAYEPIICARKGNDGTYANNALKHGVSGLNIDGGRIPAEGRPLRVKDIKDTTHNTFGDGLNGSKAVGTTNVGRFPANIILDEEAGEMLDEQSGSSKSQGGTKRVDTDGVFSGYSSGHTPFNYGDKGGASRFFYCAKASKSERNAGCERLETNDLRTLGDIGSCDNAKPSPQTATKMNNHHPTVKPLKLMEYLCTLTKTPTGGTVLDPFAGSGTTGIAAKNTGREYILIEMEKEYIDICEARLK